ncbi:hypothetical protein C7293_31525, partial [filamentous cyanobacterium CCT1]
MTSLNRASTTVILFASVSSFLLGLVIMVAWHWQITAIIQIIPNTPPMPYNSSLALLLSGLGLLCLQLKQRRWALGWGSGVLLIGGLTLLQYLWDIDLGIDELLMHDYITGRLLQLQDWPQPATVHPLQQLIFVIEHPVPGRPSPNTALGLVFVGVALVALSWVNTLPTAGGRTQRWTNRAHVIATTGSLGVIAIGTVALLGYIVQIDNIYTWRYLTGISIPIAVEFPLLGLGLMLIALRASPGEGRPRWLPISIGFGFITMSLLLWQVVLSWHGYLAAQLSPSLANQLNQLVIPVAHLLLISGILLACLVMGTLYLYEQAQGQARRLQRLNQTLAQT